ncbi:MAG TPA: ADOP family duplicated permease [Vicinamibacterales bacterium]|nr:ADOP family duplicated permease [Vicinamibacterales bacterium]
MTQDQRGRLLDALARDTRHGLRRLLRDWRFTAAAVAILGLAIGANTAIFSLVDAVLFGTPLPDAGRLVNVYQNDRTGRPLVVASYGAYLRVAEHTDVYAAAMAATIPSQVRYLHDGAARQAVVEYATASYLDVLRLRPSLGRWFDDGEARSGAPLVAIVGHQTWTRVFHADPSIVGRVIRMEGAPVTIVGVGPADYRGTIDVGLGTDFWLPVTALPAMSDMPAGRADPAIHAPLLVKARLRDGVSVDQAAAAMGILARRLQAEFPDDFRRDGELALGPGITVVASNDVRVHPQADGPIKALASLVLVLVGLVLAIACSNLATLLLVRGAARAKDISVRLALGATRLQLVRHLLIESLLIALAGGTAGCVLAWWGLDALRHLDLPVSVELSLDYRVLALTMALSLLTGMAFGLAPALEATRADLLPTLRDGGLVPIDRRRLTLKHALIVGQVAVSVLLLGGTSAFVQELAAARALRVGYAVDGVAMLETDWRLAGYSEAAAATASAELLRRVAAIPGVQSAALLHGLPMEAASVPVVLDTAAGQPGSTVEASLIPAGPGFFDTLRIPLLYGRAFDGRDRAGTQRVAVVTERMARQYFGAVDAVGRRFRPADDPDAWTEVIGIVRDTGTGNLADDVLDPIAPAFYTTYTQAGAPPATVIARTSADAGALAVAMQRELRAVDVTLPAITATTMAQALEASRAAPKTAALLLGVLGGLGLVLASIGLYAVVALAVAQRSHEIGIRMALGASARQVVWSIVRGVGGLMAAGTGAGLLLAIAALLAMQRSSGDVGIGNLAIFHPRLDPIALLAIAAAAVAVGVLAAFVPGRRAARMDPLAALRRE